MLDQPATGVRQNARPELRRTPSTPPDLSVLVPTRDEAGNIEELLRRVSAAVTGVRTEIIVVDDSDDDTPAVVRTAARRVADAICQVVLIHRRGVQRAGGLGGAVVDGLRVARASWACVLDADLQHPPEVIPALLATVERDRVDLVIASRHREQGGMRGLGPLRWLISSACTVTARLLFPFRLRGVTDPMSGFFMVRTAAVDLDALRPRGFKILLELLVRGGSLRRAEVGFVFAERHAGRSKGSLREGLRYLRTLAELRLGVGSAPSRPADGVPAPELLVPVPQDARTV